MPRQRENAGEGRAHAARPSLCLLLAVLASVCAMAAPAAQAAPQLTELEVTQTSPASSESAPANSTTPLVIGHENGGITTKIRGLPDRFSLSIAASVEPSEEVAIYTEAGCAGEAVAFGTLNEFEGTGIAVEVPSDSTTTFYARHFDPTEASEPSVCSKKGFSYWESSTVVTPPVEPPSGEPPVEQRPTSSNPPVAPRLHTLPAGVANDNSPLIVGSAPGAERVKIFTNVSCSGPPVANVAVGELSAGVVMHVADNSTTDFAGLSIAGGKQSFCSPPATYIEDSSPPLVRITMGPGVKTRRHKAVFRFTAGSEELGTAFQCRLNHGKWKACHSPFKLKHLRFRGYILRVRGTDSVGNTTPKPAQRRFKVIH
jgi:hypothetical protein